MKILHLSDTHGCHRRLRDLPEADVLVHSGDFCMVGSEQEALDFLNWLCDLPYRHKLFICGNHDECLYAANVQGLDGNVHYLCNSGIEINGVKFYGVPMFVRDSISGRQSRNYAQIPEDTDVLITHLPPYGILDCDSGINYGSQELLDRVIAVSPRLHLFGHIHRQHCITSNGITTFSNGAIMSDDFSRFRSPNVIPIVTWYEHIRCRPGMYIGKPQGDGSHSDDGIYGLIKYVIDNSIDEFNMGAGKRIEIEISENRSVTVRDYGRGIPFDEVIDAASKITPGRKCDSKTFKRSIGGNGVNLKTVNALSRECTVESVRNGQKVSIEFNKGVLTSGSGIQPTSEENGTRVTFTPDDTLFRGFAYRMDVVETVVKNYTCLNAGLSIYLNGKKYCSRHGMLDMLTDNMTSEPLYPIIHLQGDDIEVVLTHTNQPGEVYYSFVNGHHTTQGGTHLTAFREHLCRTIKDFSGKGYGSPDIRNGIVAAIAVRIQEPVFADSIRRKLGSKEIAPDSPVTVNKFIGDFIKKELDDYLHRHTDVAEAMLAKIAASRNAKR